MNKDVIKFISIVLLFCSMYKTSTAQNQTTNFLIKGKVMDSVSQKPLQFCTVRLVDSSDNDIVITISNEDGYFKLNCVKTNKMKLILSNISYQNKLIDLSGIDSISNDKDLGIIVLNPQAKSLTEVIVTAKAPIIRQERDRILYNIQSDPESKVNSVLGMMRKVPFLSLDANENILLKGTGNFKILIDGKPSSLVENNPKDVLKNIPASTIQRIEVITTPSAKYDAEGMAGIINIITIKKIDNGYSGNLSLNYQYPMGGPGVGTNFTLKKNKIGVTGFAGLSRDKMPSTIIGTDFKNILYRLYQNGSKSQITTSGYFGTNISYEVDSLNLISFQLNANKSINKGNFIQNNFVDSLGMLKRQYFNKTDNEGNSSGIETGINYEKGFKNDKKKLLTFSYKYYNYETSQLSHSDLSTIIGLSQFDSKQNNTGSFGEHTAQIDLVHSVKKVNLETGLKAILRNNNSIYGYSVFDSYTNKYVEIPGSSDNYTNKQSVYGFYNNLNTSYKSWFIQIGGRVEYTLVNAAFLSTNSKVQQKYFNVIPTLFVNNKVNEFANINFGFT